MSAARAGIAIVCLIAGGAAGFALRPAGADPAELDALRDQLASAEGSLEAAKQELSDAQSRARSAERDLKTARRELSESESAAADAAVAASAAAADTATDAAAESVADGDETWETRVGSYPAYAFSDTEPKVQEAIADIDWVSISSNMSSMVPIADRIAEAIENGEQPSADDIGNAQKHNGPLVVAAIKLNQAGVPGTGPNGAFSHPAFMTNAIAGSLEAVGKPLTTEQKERLGRLGADFARRDQERMGAYGDDAVELRKIVEEAELKDTYFAEVFAMLDAQQRDALSPEVSRGRLQLDVFSGCLVWAGRVRQMGYRDTDHLVELVEGTFMAGVPDDAKGRAHDIVVAWAEGLPRDITAFERNALDQAGLFEGSHVNLCAKQVVALIETLRRDGNLGDALREGLRKSQGTIVPFPLPE